MKKKEKIQKLIDLILEEEQYFHDDWCANHDKGGAVCEGLGCIIGMCDEHSGSGWCEKHCNMYFETPKKNYEKCIRHWYLGED